MQRALAGFVITLGAGGLLSSHTVHADSEQSHLDAARVRKAPVIVADVRPALAPPAAKTMPPDWVVEKPGFVTQRSKSAGERGINPCLTRDPGFGGFTKWNRSVLMGQVILPRHGAVSDEGEFDVMFHFHGHEAARKEWVQVMRGGVLAAVDLGNGSGPYHRKFRAPAMFEEYVKSVERAVAEKAGRANARVRKVGLSAWSAGYGAIEEILRTEYGRRLVDTVVLLDGLHCAELSEAPTEPRLTPFVDFARSAAHSNKLMFVSHSSIIPPNYASTTEAANYLVWQVGGEPLPARRRKGDPMGLELISSFSAGDFHVRGFTGNGALDHCAHIGLYADVLEQHVAPRWKLPTRRSKG